MHSDTKFRPVLSIKKIFIFFLSKTLKIKRFTPSRIFDISKLIRFFYGSFLGSYVYRNLQNNVTYRWTTLRFCNFRVLRTPKHVEPSKTEN